MDDEMRSAANSDERDESTRGSAQSAENNSGFARSERTSHGSSINERFNPNENHHENSSDVHGEACIYESIKESENVETGESQDVTYSLIELKRVGKKRKDHKPEESPVYADVKIETADESLTYAQINRHNKGKAKNKKGKHQNPEESPIYSKVKTGTTDGLTYAQIKHDSKGKAKKKKGL
ncbi:hypothetical protein Q5P01_000639 [Channa striata]|uniref:Uncharacterized protein n=1 Tax=Channa striata TaxID=64152 RepID=A0AA88II82_CHASR|nr:hypothetical protein Q5P01_000639 [Channa striata]